MNSFKKRYYSYWVGAIVASVLGLTSFAFYFTGFHILPSKIQSDSSQLCLNHLEDKSYQIKQLILENVNNSKLWVANRQNAFFDSRWFAISYYEHDGQEWVLKDFKINPIALNLYNMNSSDFVKSDQSLVFPHFESEQMSLQETAQQTLPLLVIDVPNFLPTVPRHHLVRISLFSDIFASTLNANESCPLKLFDARGNFMLRTNNFVETEFLQKFSSAQTVTSSEVNSLEFDGQPFFSKKILKNLFILAQPAKADSGLTYSFLEILLANLILVGSLIWVLVRHIQSDFLTRVEDIRLSVQSFSRENSNVNLNMSHTDELTPLEEDLFDLSENTKKKKR